jgi:hypothetical protein
MNEVEALWRRMTVWQKLVLALGGIWLAIFSAFVPSSSGWGSSTLLLVPYRFAWELPPQDVNWARLIMTLGAIASAMAFLLVLLRKPTAGSAPPPLDAASPARSARSGGPSPSAAAAPTSGSPWPGPA